MTKCKVPGQQNLVECGGIGPDDPGYGQDGHFPSGALDFLDLGDGTVRDNKTGLVWQKATTEADWNTAKSTCASPWRLPDVYELLSMADYSKESCPMWHEALGTACPSPSWFWTSVPWSSSSAFGVNFDGGDVGGVDVEFNVGVRCVRAGQ